MITIQIILTEKAGVVVTEFNSKPTDSTPNEMLRLDIILQLLTAGAAECHLGKKADEKLASLGISKPKIHGNQ